MVMEVGENPRILFPQEVETWVGRHTIEALLGQKSHIDE